MNILNDILFQSISISTLYGTMMAALIDDVFKFAIIVELFELKLTFQFQAIVCIQLPFQWC